MIKTIWNFSRPHTIIGSITSIVTLYIIICEKNKAAHLDLLMMALLIGVCINIFIVGINQIADVELDKINKPYLPLPSGELSLQGAQNVTYACLLISLAMALYISAYLFYIILLSAFIGWSYSMPPLHLKRHHLSSALAISFVRGILINVGGFLVFNYIVNKKLDLPENVKILAVFILVFSIVIAWFKDLPDVKGDAMYNIRSLAIVYSPRSAFIAGNFLIISTYLITIVLKYMDFKDSSGLPFQTAVLLYGHIFLLVLFLINTFTVNLMHQPSIKKYYMRFWMFFFAEYILYLVAYI